MGDKKKEESPRSGTKRKAGSRRTPMMERHHLSEPLTLHQSPPEAHRPLPRRSMSFTPTRRIIPAAWASLQYARWETTPPIEAEDRPDDGGSQEQAAAQTPSAIITPYHLVIRPTIIVTPPTQPGSETGEPSATPSTSAGSQTDVEKKDPEHTSSDNDGSPLTKRRWSCPPPSRACDAQSRLYRTHPLLTRELLDPPQRTQTDRPLGAGIQGPSPEGAADVFVTRPSSPSSPVECLDMSRQSEAASSSTSARTDRSPGAARGRPATAAFLHRLRHPADTRAGSFITRWLTRLLTTRRRRNRISEEREVERSGVNVNGREAVNSSNNSTGDGSDENSTDL